MTSSTMSANSSDVDVVAGPGTGGCVGSALAAPIANAENPITAPATNSHRIATPFSLLHSLIPPAKLAPDRIRRMPNATTSGFVRQAYERRRDSSAC
jgi:hypothetical protein